MQLPAFALLGWFAASGRAQPLADLYDTDRFHWARFDSSREITFRSFQELDWEAKARAALTWLNLDHPTKAQIARLQEFEPAGPQFRRIDFRAPLEPVAARASYLLIAPMACSRSGLSASTARSVTASTKA